MTPERARELAHRVPHAGHAPAVPEHGSVKRREIRFTKMPPEQSRKAAELLAGMEYLEVANGPHPRGITVRYDLIDYTYEGLEKGPAQPRLPPRQLHLLQDRPRPRLLHRRDAAQESQGNRRA